MTAPVFISSAVSSTLRYPNWSIVVPALFYLALFATEVAPAVCCAGGFSRDRGCLVPVLFATEVARTGLQKQFGAPSTWHLLCTVRAAWPRPGPRGGQQSRSGFGGRAVAAMIFTTIQAV